jgi:hypothetical protein
MGLGLGRPARATAVASGVGVLLFWAGISAAGLVADGYSARGDYISNLAARGSPVAVLAIVALLASAAAHLSTSLLARRVDRPVGWLLLAAAVATVSIAGFRQSCPDGPAGCSQVGPPSGDWMDAAHSVSVVAYQVVIVAAMVTLAVGSARRAGRWPHWLGVLSVVTAAASVLLLLASTGGDDSGLWQRLWVANNLGWLLVVAWTAAP